MYVLGLVNVKIDRRYRLSMRVLYPWLAVGLLKITKSGAMLSLVGIENLAFLGKLHVVDDSPDIPIDVKISVPLE